MNNNEKMLSDCLYDTVKTLHNISSIIWFLKKHAVQEAHTEKHTECAKIYENICKDLEKYIEPLKQEICRGCK